MKEIQPLLDCLPAERLSASATGGVKKPHRYRPGIPGSDLSEKH